MADINFDDELQISFNSQLLELISHPVFIKNTAGVYINCNDAFANFLKLDKSKIIGSTAFDLAPASLANVYHAADHELFISQKTQIYTNSVLDHSKKLHEVEFSKFIMHASENRLAGFIGVIRDSRLKKPNSIDKKIHLSQREIDVLSYSAKGLSVKEIAKQLLVSHHTVAHHFKSIHYKLGVKNKMLAILVAKKHNLID